MKGREVRRRYSQKTSKTAQNECECGALPSRSLALKIRLPWGKLRNSGLWQIRLKVRGGTVAEVHFNDGGRGVGAAGFFWRRPETGKAPL